MVKLVAALGCLAAATGVSVAAGAPVAFNSGFSSTFFYVNNILSRPASLCRNVLNYPNGDQFQFWYATAISGTTVTPSELMTVYDSIETALTEKAAVIAQLAISGRCVSKYLELLCLTSFSPTIGVEATVDGSIQQILMPQPISHSVCETMMQECAEANAQFGFIDFYCDSVVPMAGLPAHKNFYFNQYEGQPAFPSGDVQVEFWVGAIGNSSLEQFKISPVVPSSFSATDNCGAVLNAKGNNETTCTANEFFAETNDCRCVLAPACPFPAYDQSTYNAYMASVIVLLCISLPFLLAITVYFKKFKNVPFIPWVAGSALLYVFIEVILTAVKGTDFSCIESELGRDISWTTTAGQVKQDYLCYVSRIQVHVLQVILGAAGCAFFGVYDAVASAHKGVNVNARMSGSASKRMLKRLLIFTFVLLTPLVCMIMTLTYGNERGGKFQAFNVIRYAFSCGPEYDNIWMEIAFVHVPIVFSGSIILVMCCLITRVAWQLHKRASGFGAIRNNDTSKDSSTKKKKRISTALTIAKRVAVFGFLTVVFLFAYSFSAIMILLDLEDFSNHLSTFLDCQIGFEFSACGDALSTCVVNKHSEETCAALDPRSKLPAAWLMGLNFCSPAVIPLMFGLMFGITHVYGLFANFWNWLATCGTVDPINRSYGAERLFYTHNTAGNGTKNSFGSSHDKKDIFTDEDCSNNNMSRLVPFTSGDIVAPERIFNLGTQGVSSMPSLQPGQSAPPPGVA